MLNQMTSCLLLGTQEHHVCPAIVDVEQYRFLDRYSRFGESQCDDLDSCTAVSCIALGSFIQILGITFIIVAQSARRLNPGFPFSEGMWSAAECRRFASEYAMNFILPTMAGSQHIKGPDGPTTMSSSSLP